MKNFIRGLCVMIMAVAYSAAAFNISGKIANWDPDTEGTFMIIASTKPDFSVINASTDIFCASGNTAAYTLSGLPDGTYFVVAILDLNSSGGQPEPNEPSGVYSVCKFSAGAEPIAVAGTDAFDIDFVCQCDVGPYLLRGLAEDNAGNPLVGSIVKYENYALQNDTSSTLNFSTSTLAGAKISSSVDPAYIPDYNWEIVIDTTTSLNSVGYDGEYQRIVISSTSYNDCDFWIYFDTGSSSGDFFKTVHSTAIVMPEGNITGIIDYTGSAMGDLNIQAGHGGSLIFSTTVLSGSYTFPYYYDTGNIEVSTDYTVIAWVDSTGDMVYDMSNEAGAAYPSASVTVSDGMTTSSIDFTLQDPGTSPPPAAGVTINVDSDGYDFSAGTAAAWGSGADIMYTLAFGTPAALEVINGDIYDAGTAWADVDSVNTFENTGGDGHIVPQVDHYYTFRDDIDNKETVIKVTAVSATSVTFEYNYDYMSAGTASYTYYDTGEGIPVSFESVSVTSDGGDNIISPNGDNIDDEFRVNYILTSPSATIMSGGGANVRIIADTNNNGIADVFKWEQVMWENDAPHFIPGTVISSTTNVAYYNVNGNDWWGYFNSLSQDAKDALKLSYQELDAIQANSDYDFWEWISQDDFYDAGGAYKTNMKSLSINFSWDWLKRIPLNGDCKVFIEVAAPYFSPQTLSLGESIISTVTITGVGVIKGTVTLPAESGGGPAAFAEVNAGNQYSWNHTYTDENGEYIMRGLAEGSYFMEARKAGFTLDRKDNVVLSGDEAWQHFELGTGVRLEATIVLPSAFQPYTDQWGNTVNELWGNLDAWSMNSPDGGWANFRISSGASSAVCVLPLVEGTYSLRAHADKYVSISTTVVLKPASEGGVLGAGATFYQMPVPLSPAVDIKGYIVINSTNVNELQQRYIDVNAHTADNSVWAWGQREWDQNLWDTTTVTGATLMPFTVWNVTPNKDYVLQFWSQFYAEKSTTVTVGAASLLMTKAEAIEMDEGVTISGDVVINWSPTTYAIYENQSWDDNGVKKIWLNIDAFDEATHQGKNIGFSVRISSDSSIPVIAPYTIAGLTAGRQYQMNIWGLNNGFEQEERWKKVTPSTSPVNIIFNPFSGSITGTILDQSGNPVSVSTSIVISCDMQWDRGMPNSDVTLHPSTTGFFCIDELRTGEYIITIMEQGPDGMPLGNYGLVQKRAMVNNGENYPLGHIHLKPAGQIRGTLILNSDKYPTWDDVHSASTQTYYVYDHMGTTHEGSPMELVVRAISVKQMQQGGNPMESDLKAHLDVWPGNPCIASYTICGLAEGSYIILPPLYFDPSNDGQAGMFGGHFSPNGDLAAQIQMVPLVTGETKVLPPLTLIDGVNVKGTVQRSQSGVEGHYWVEIISRENFAPVSPGKPVDFFDGSTMGMSNTLNSPAQSFSFSSIYPGKYNAMVRVWDQSYKDAIVPFEIPAGSTKTIDLGTIMLKKGANITGTLRDEDTGSVVYDGVRASCHSIPHQEGTWRETRSYNDEWADPEIRISSTTGVFKLKNLPAGTYEVNVEYNNSNVSYAYVQKRIVGVIVPDSTADVDLGTIELKKGNNISGIVKDVSGNPVPNVKVEAEPMFGMTNGWTDFMTDSEGKFVLKGMDPDVVYWKVTAAPRPEVWDRWEEESYYAPTIRKNVMVGSTNTVLTVALPTKGITGVIMTPVIASKDDMEIVMPAGFGDGKAGLKTYGAFIILQNRDERYADPFDGYQTISRAPFWEDGRWKSSFTIMGLSDGSYNMRVLVKNFCSEFVSGIEISSGTIVWEPVSLSTGAVLSGVFAKADGSKVKSAEVECVVAANQDMTEITFGNLVTNTGTGEIESYSIPGLRKNISYTVVLPMGEDALFMAPEPQYITQNAQTYDFIFQDHAPLFISWVKKSSNTITIEAFASEPIRESVGTDILVLDAVYDIDGSTVSGSFDSIAISLNKTDIRAEFTFSGVQNSIVYHFEGTDLKGNNQSPDNWSGTDGYPFSYRYYKAWDNYAQKNINPTFGGSVEVGNGDNSEVYVPIGSMDTDSDVKVTVGKTEFPSESVPAPAALISGARSASAVQAYTAKRDSFYTARYGAAMPSLEGPELAISTMSALYEIKARLVSGPLASIAASQAVDLTFEYDPSISTYPATDNIYVYSSTASSNAEWNLVDSAPSINTDDNTITVQTNHFSYFAVFKLSAVPSVVTSSPTIVSVSPTSGNQGTSFDMTITGTEFNSGAGVSFSNYKISFTSVSIVSATQITVHNVDISSTAATGSCNITVTNADGGYYTAPSVFIVNSKDISVTAVTPVSAQQYETVWATVTGTGLTALTNARFELSGYTFSVSTFTLVFSTTVGLEFQVPAVASTGTYNLVMWNSGTSESYTYENAFTVNYAISFTTVTPNRCEKNTTAKSITITGSGFGTSQGSGGVAFSGSGITVAEYTSWADNQIVITVDVSAAADSGERDITVTNSNGSLRTLGDAFTVYVEAYLDGFKSYVFPNPCRANSLSIKVCVPGTAADILAGSAVNGEIKIYTITGELVRSISKQLEKGYGPGDLAPASWSGKNIINWDLKNSNGGNVSSGVYFYIVEAAGQGRDKGKIAIIR